MNANLNAIAAANYILRITEASRHDDDYNDQPALTPDHITNAHRSLTRAAASLDAQEPNAECAYPTIDTDGDILYCQVGTMTARDVEAALTALAAERAWLDRHRERLVHDYAALLKLRDRIKATGAANVRSLNAES